MTNVSGTSGQGWEADSGMGQGKDQRPDVTPPTSGRTSRRKPEQISAARKLRDDVLALVEERPRTETELVRATGCTKGEVKSALRRLVNADLVFSREGASWREAPVWHHWPTVIANLKASGGDRPRQRFEVVRATGMRVA